MLRYNINLNGNILSIANNILGKESITYNGELKSAKTTFGGTKHIFTATEAGEPVQYEVDFRLRYLLSIEIEVKRNGNTVFTNF